MTQKQSKTYNSFNIIRFRGNPTHITLIDGSVQEKKTHIFIKEINALVPCAPYDNHFIFEVPVKIKGPSLMCTCGSGAGWVGSDAYSAMASPAGMLLVCFNHMTFGKHSDGSL